MSERAAARLGWALFGVAVLLFVAALVLNLRRPQYATLEPTTGDLMVGLTLLPYGWFGALIVARQPRQPMGWLLCALGLTAGVAGFANEYTIYGLVTRPGAAPGATVLAWCTQLLSAMLLALLTALLVLFPSGRPVSPRWRWVLWLAGIGNGLFVVSALWWWPRRGIALLQLHYSAEPVGALGVCYTIGWLAGLVALLAAVVSLVVRFRRARGAERQQLKWLAYGRQDRRSQPAQGAPGRCARGAAGRAALPATPPTGRGLRLAAGSAHQILGASHDCPGATQHRPPHPSPPSRGRRAPRPAPAADPSDRAVAA